jgi:hypothetical protein
VLTVAGLAGCGDGGASDGEPPTTGPDGSLDVADDAPAVDVPAIDTARGRIGTSVPDGETVRGTERTTGLPCTDDAICDPAHTGDNMCTAHHFSALGSLYPSPLCVGRECDPGPTRARPLPCDEGHGVCVGDGVLVGSCLPGCTFDAIAPARGCPAGTVCTPSWLERDLTGAIEGLGWCAPACTADEQCSGGDHCLVDEGICIGIPITRTLALGARCDAYANPPEIECNCLHDQATGVGTCAAVCTPGDPKRACPDGFLCTTGLPRALFATEPSGVVAHCLATCTTDADCSVFDGRCVEGPSGKTCLVGAPPGP